MIDTQTELGSCLWLVLCENPATHLESHAMLGEVPCCDRCVSLGRSEFSLDAGKMRLSYYDIEHRVTAYLMDLNDDCYLLTELQTGKNFRGQGHAGRLLDHVLAEADTAGATICLEVSPDNSIGSLGYQALLDFYLRRGFVPVEERSLVRVPGGESDISSWYSSRLAVSYCAT